MEECRTIKEPMEDQSGVVHTVDKVVAMVIMDKQDYTDKALSLLSDTSTCRILNKDPTNKLIQTLKDIKQAGGLSDQSYRKMYPTGAVPHKFYGLPKIHLVGTLLGL